MNSKRLFYSLISGLILSSFVCVGAKANSMMKDPTQPPLYQDTPPVTSPNREFKISAIYYGEKSKTVRIEGLLFEVGDKISGYTITAINKDTVKLKNESGEFEFVMPYSEIKTLTKGKENSEK